MDIFWWFLKLVGWSYLAFIYFGFVYVFYFSDANMTSVSDELSPTRRAFFALLLFLMGAVPIFMGMREWVFLDHPF